MPMILARVRLALIYSLLLLPVILFGACGAVKCSNHSPLDWVRHDFPARQKYAAFVEQFGSGDAVIASWPGCTWDNPRLDRLVRALRESRLFRSPEGAPYFESIVCGRETLLRMTQSGRMAAAAETPGPATTSRLISETASGSALSVPGAMELMRAPDKAAGASAGLSIPPALAVKRLRGTLIGPDGRTTCVILNLSPSGLLRRSEVVQRIRRSIMVGCDVAEPDIHLAGPVIDGYTVDAASQRSLASFVVPSALVIFLVCWLSLKSLPGAMLVFSVAAFCQAGTLAVIYYAGETMSALLVILPPLIQVLAVAGGIHLMNYYFDSLETFEPQQAAIEAFRRGWLPCSLSAGTTAMGTASLMVSGLTPIRLFGAFATAGVILTAVSVLVAIPCGLMVFPVRRRPAPRSGPLAAPDEAASDCFVPASPFRERREPHHPEQRQDVWSSLRNLLHARNTAVLVGTVALMVLSCLGLPQVRASVRIETLFPAGSRILSDYQWLETHLGCLVPIEVVVRFDRNCDLDPCERLELLHGIETQLEAVPAIETTTSALTFFPPQPPLRNRHERERRLILSHAIESARPAFVSLSVLRTSPQAESWRMTAYASAIAPLDYGSLLHDVDRVVNRVIRDNTRGTDGISFSAAGIMPLVHEIQKRLLSDLFESLLSALVVITLTMTLAEAGFINGLISMVSSVFPIVILFGVMGWLGTSMDIGSIMTASVALGIAVDDTLHFLTFFRRSVASGTPRPDAVLWAYRHCGPAMIQTSATCGIGLLIFAFSDFLPTSRFAVIMASLLLLALVGDLVVLPALLLSPLGRYFERLPVAADADRPADVVTALPQTHSELTPARLDTLVPV